ncbi:MAG: nucleotide exchange factor GrpE, partial [Pseudomonadota bacterium]|nr:nucleotide exchange factor GrpE [Pseudomonadota bacterium]
MDNDIKNGAEQGTAAVDTEGARDANAGEDALARLQAENAELRDRSLRVLAEMENLRRRTEREVKDASQYAIAAFARDMLTVGDNLRRALDALGPTVREGADQAFTTLLDGVELTEREMLKAFEKHGVRRLSPQGERFDPNLHQAMFEVPDPSVPSGTVVQVMQDGYVIGDRVLRPALVGIAKGGPRAQAAEPA